MVDDLSLAFDPFTKKRDDFIGFSSPNGLFGYSSNRPSLGMAFIHGIRLGGCGGGIHEFDGVLYFMPLSFSWFWGPCAKVYVYRLLSELN